MESMRISGGGGGQTVVVSSAARSNTAHKETIRSARGHFSQDGTYQSSWVPPLLSKYADYCNLYFMQIRCPSQAPGKCLVQPPEPGNVTALWF